MTRPGLIPTTAPCVVSHNLALGGAQIAVLRMIGCLPDWVRERTVLYSQSTDVPLLDAAVRNGFSVGSITHEAPSDPSSWLLSYGNLQGLPERPTSLILHSWDDEGWRYIQRAYGSMRGMTIAGVSQQVLARYADWAKEHGHTIAGVLPPPVTEYTMVKGRRNANRIVVAWMGRPLESKGLLSLPHLLKLDDRLIVRAWTGAATGGNEYVRRTQGETLDKLISLASKLGVLDRLDIRPLDFDPFNYKERLRGAHVLLGNSKREGFLMTAAEALSCGVPVVVTRSCGVADFVVDGVNGALIDWDEDPKRLARSSYHAISKAVPLSQRACLDSVETLAAGARYRQVYGPILARLTHTSLQCEESDARVTVGVRIHKGMPTSHLDDAISSLAMQTCRQFKTILLVDGPHDYAEKLAARYDLPLICTGVEPDITHCSGLHRWAVEQCDTEFYKPLDYDDQLLPNYLERAVATLDASKADVYGCLLMTLDQQSGICEPRWWPHKPIETMFTGKSDDNQLPHSSVMMRTAACLRAGNYQERAVGLGADDYNLWYRLHKTGAAFVRDDAVRNVVYRIHEKNSLKIRKARYGGGPVPQANVGRGRFVAGAAAAASMALWAAPQGTIAPAHAADAPAAQRQEHAAPAASSSPKMTNSEEKKKSSSDQKSSKQKNGKSSGNPLTPPQS